MRFSKTLRRESVYLFIFILMELLVIIIIKMSFYDFTLYTVMYVQKRAKFLISFRLVQTFVYPLYRSVRIHRKQEDIVNQSKLLKYW
jgi:hypothetical protein